MRVVVAPDKFKGSLTAPEVAAAVARGIRAAAPWAAVKELPIADGGDGTLHAALAVGFTGVPVTAVGPTGLPGSTRYARSSSTALIELASVCGLARLPPGERDPLHASSRGLGEVVAAALDAGHRRLILGLGGSASTDGGAGLLVALGAQVLDRSGRPVPDGGVELRNAVTLDLSELHPGLADADIILACDVDNPLTGPVGAAAVFAPQKGAGPSEVAQLEAALDRWADVVASTVGRDLRDLPGAGAAGGVAFGAMAVCGARRSSGVDVVLDLVGFEAAATGAELVVVGEGSLDAQTLHGKAPLGTAWAAARAGAKVVAVCGRRRLDDHALRSVGISAAYACEDLVDDPGRSMADAAELLERIGSEIGRRHVPISLPDRATAD